MPFTSTLKHTLLLIGSIVQFSATTPKIQPTTTEIDVCTLHQFQWHLNSAAPYCCPGILDQVHGDASKAYCCVGAHPPDNAVWTTTQTSCATRISVYPQTGYSSKVREAATKYGITYTTDVGGGGDGHGRGCAGGEWECGWCCCEGDGSGGVGWWFVGGGWGFAWCLMHEDDMVSLFCGNRIIACRHGMS